MTQSNFDELRDNDRTVLHCIEEGWTDTQEITKATSLETYQTRHSLKKLGGLGLVELTKQDGMVERVIDGQKRVFNAPYRGELTDAGKRYLTRAGADGAAKELTKDDFVDRVQELEDQVEELERSFEIFRKQVRNSLE